MRLDLEKKLAASSQKFAEAARVSALLKELAAKIEADRATHEQLAIQIETERAAVSRRADLGVRIWACGFGRADLGVRIWPCGFGRADLGVRIWAVGFSQVVGSMHQCPCTSAHAPVPMHQCPCIDCSSCVLQVASEAAKEDEIQAELVSEMRELDRSKFVSSEHDLEPSMIWNRARFGTEGFGTSQSTLAYAGWLSCSIGSLVETVCARCGSVGPLMGGHC